MHRTTIMLPPDLRRKADREAKALGISLSELIRRRLSAGGLPEPGAKPRFFSRQPWQGAGGSDTAANHDQYLYGP
jgi:hypothetical protein